MNRMGMGLATFRFAARRVIGHLGYVLASVFLAVVAVTALVLLLSLAAMITNLPLSLPFVSSVSIDPAGAPASTDISPDGFRVASGILALAIYGAVLQSLTEARRGAAWVTGQREPESSSPR